MLFPSNLAIYRYENGNFFCSQKQDFQNFMSKKFVITGGLGFIGSHAAIKCINSGDKCLIIDAKKTGSGKSQKHE